MSRGDEWDVLVLLADSCVADFSGHVDRISKLSGRVDGAAVERILDNAAKAVADLEVSNEQ